MRIGSRQFGDQSLAVTQPRIAEGAFGEGVARGLRGLGDALTQYGVDQAALERELQARQEAQTNTAAANIYARFQGQINRELMELRRSAPPGAAGITEQTNALARERISTFLEELPENLREEYRTRAEAVVQGHLTSAFAFELEQADTATRNNLTQLREMARSAVGQNPGDAEAQLADLHRAIQASTLSEIEKEAAMRDAEAAIRVVEAQTLLAAAAQETASQRTADGRDAVAPGLAGYERGLLNAIASVESPGYDVMYGGSQFTDYSRHPNIRHRITSGPNAGQFSTAAGRYQFIYGTWTMLQRMYPDQLPDFSPASQDRAALLYAQLRYSRATGGNMLEELRSGDRGRIAAVGRVLAGSGNNTAWEGLQGMSGDRFANMILGSAGVAGGGTGTYDEPNIWQDPRFANLTHDQRVAIEAQAQEQSQQAMQATMQAQLQRETDRAASLIQGLATGQTTVGDIAEILQSGQVRMDRPRQALQQAIAGELEAMQTFAATAGALQANQPMTAADSDALNVYEERSGIRRGLQEGDVGAQQHLAEMFARGGRVSNEMAAMLQQMAMSAVPGQSESALNALRMMHDMNSRGLAANHPDLYQLAARWDAISRTRQGAEAQAMLRQETDPAFVQQRRQRREQAEEQFTEAFADDHQILRAFESRWIAAAQGLAGMIGYGPGATRLADNPLANNMLRNDFYREYIRAFEFHGNHDAAVQEAVTLTSRRIAPSTVGGESPRLLWLPPEAPASGVETFEGSVDWVNNFVRNEFGWGSDRNFTLVTAMDPEPGQVPFYYVYSLNEDGALELALGDDNLPRMVRPELTDELRTHMLEESQRINQSVQTNRERLETGTTALPETQLQPELPQGQNYVELERQASRLRQQLEAAERMTLGRNPSSSAVQSMENLRLQLDAVERAMDAWRP